VTVEGDAPQQEDGVALVPVLCRLETEVQWREWEPSCTPEDVPTQSPAMTVNDPLMQQEDGVAIVPVLRRFETPECWLDWAPRDVPPPSVMEKQEAREDEWLGWQQHSWKIDENKISNKQREHSLPTFDLWEGGTFRLILRADTPNGGFQASNGVGRVELKFIGGTEFNGKVHYRVAVGQDNDSHFQDLEHNFAMRAHSTMPQEWNFKIAAKKKSLVVRLEARLEKLPA